MKLLNNLKVFAITVIAIWATAEACLAQDGNAYTSGGPVSGSDEQTAAIDLVGKQAQKKVDLFTGSFTYSIPIACAPARNGSQPNLALAYSSSDGLDWCGMGWKLDIGSIDRNVRDGFPVAYSSSSPAAPLNQYDDTKGFMLNLFGKGYKLFSVSTNGTIVEYRAEVDTDFLRCFADTNNNNWVVYDKSGTAYYFGENSATRVSNPKTGWSGYSGTFHWALDQIVTASGDWTTISYTNSTSPYTGLPERELYPFQIAYNGHTNYNGYTANYPGPDTITFQTQLRTNDWRFSFRSGFRTDQTRRLTNILCQIGTQTVWSYSLNYAISPATGRSLLTNIIVYGYSSGTATPFLTNSFAYQANPNGVSFGSPIIWTNMLISSPSEPGGYNPEVAQVNQTGGFNYNVADLVDIDGDGLPDRVSWNGTNAYQVQKNLGMQANGNGLFGSPYSFGPTSTGAGSIATNSNPFPNESGYTGLNNPYGRLMDINGDGIPDRVEDYWWAINSAGSGATTYVPYTNYEVQLNLGNGFSSVSNWSVNTGPLPTSNANSLYYYCVEDGAVNVGLFDINGDGRPDRVMSQWWQNANMTNFLVQLNTGTNFGPVVNFGPYYSQNYYVSNTTDVYDWAGVQTPNANMIDINGDGLPDRVMWPFDVSGNNLDAPHPSSFWAVEYNDGYRFESTNTSTSIPGAFDQWPGVVAQANNGTLNYNGTVFYSDAINDLPFGGLFDVNGDGLPDRVVVEQSTLDTSSTNVSWLVYLNNGHGFDTNPIVLANMDDEGQAANLSTDLPFWSPQGFLSGYGNLTTMIDINGDGLLDRVLAVYWNPNVSPFVPTAQYFLVQLNQGPYPDLMTNVNNGIGGNIAITYNPSTAYDNRVDPTSATSGSHMPIPKYVTATVTESDGVNSPQVTTYGYGGGYYDGPRREFHGFAVVTNTDPTLRSTVTYFHTGGGRNYSVLGEYQDTNSATGLGNFAKSGIPYRVESYGNDGELYHVTINQVNQDSLGNARYFPFTALTFSCDYPGNGTPNVTAAQFAYDQNTGNLTNKIEYGQVSGFNPTSVGGFTFTDTTASDDRYYNTAYAAISGNSYIVDHPATQILADGGNNTVKEMDYSYNPSSGTIAAKLTRISPGYYATSAYTNYTAYGLVGLTIDPVGVQTELTYDSTYNTYPATKRLRTVPESDSANDFITTTTYDTRSGQLAVSTDPAGLTISNSFDSFCRLTEIDKIPIGGSSVVWMKKYTYPAVLQRIVSGLATNYEDVLVNDGVGGVETRTYIDGFGRPIQTVTEGENGNYRVISMAYDGRGNDFLTTWAIFGTSINFSKPTSGQTATWIGYDAPGRVATNRAVNVTFNSNGAFSSEANLTGDTGSPLAAKTWTYVNGGNPWWIIYTDEDGQVRKYGLDAFGRTNQILELDGSNTYTNLLNYDLANNLTNIVNAKGENIYWAYNNAGDIVAMADPHLGQWIYQRDYAGRLRVQTDARGDVVSNSYVNPLTGYQDALARLQVATVFSLNYSNQTLMPAFTNAYFYDSSSDGSNTVYPGLLYEVLDNQGYEKKGYDSRERTIKTTRYLNINTNNYTTTNGYDDGDNIIAIGYPSSGPTIAYSYFHGGSINQVSLSGGGYNYYTVPASAYDQFEHVTSFTYGSSLTTTRSYYSVSERLNSISAGSVFSRTFQYTAGNDVASINGTGFSNGAVSVVYYNLHRLKTYSGLSGSYGYDPIGNITNNIEGGGSTYTYANPRIQAVRTAFGYTNLYDLCGNMIVRHGGFTNSQAMVYDPENRLSAIAQAGVMSDEFGYAYDDQRLWKRIDQNPTNIQVWIGDIYEQKDGKTLFHIFAHNEQICTFEAASPLDVGTNTSAVGYYYHEDNLNSSSALSGSSGSQVEVDVYYPFGRVQTDNPQAPFQVSRRFTGQVFDAESGLYYYNARYYDPELGRFIQPDTTIPDIANPQTYNRYSYCMNDPLTYNDPTGHYGVSDWWNDTEEGASLVINWVDTTTQSASQDVENWFVPPPVQPDPNSAQALSQQNGVWFQPIPGVGNAATAPVKAGFNAVIQTPILSPVGDEEAGVGLVEEGAKAAEGSAGKIIDAAENLGKKFTQAQKRSILDANRAKNGGELRSDLSGDKLVPSKKSLKGVTPPANEAQVDHVVPRSKGGPNTVENSQVLSRQENRAKSNTVP